MAASAALQRVDEHGWRRGFANLLSKETRESWLNRRWLIRTILWAVVINGIMAATMWSPPKQTTTPAATQPSASTSVNTADPLTTGVITFVILGGIAGGIAVIIVMQSAIIDEKKSGTAAWVLSKPVARSAFILSKLIAHGIGSLLRMVLIPGVVAFILLTARTGSPPALIPFIVGVLLLGLHLLFYLTLTLMFGTLFEERGRVLAVPLVILFGAQFLLAIAPFLGQILPWLIIMPSGGQDLSLAMEAMLGQPLTTFTPILITALWIVVFVIVAIRRFEMEEF